MSFNVKRLKYRVLSLNRSPNLRILFFTPKNFSIVFHRDSFPFSSMEIEIEDQDHCILSGKVVR